MLKTAVILNFLLAAGHVLCLFRLGAAFRRYRTEPIQNRPAGCRFATPLPITLGIACRPTVCGLCDLSAAGTIRPLPPLHPAVCTIGDLCSLRALAGCVARGVCGSFPRDDLSAAVAASAIGALYLAGGIRTFQTPRT